MTRPKLVAAVMAVVVVGLLVWHWKANWRYREAPDLASRRRRYVIGWEVRGWFLAITVPCAAGMLFGYVSFDYILPLIFFQVAGFLVADMIAPSGLNLKR
jgi:hypothetical protein